MRLLKKNVLLKSGYRGEDGKRKFCAPRGTEKDCLCPMISLDSYDWKILRILTSDGRIANNKLAERIGLSATPCWNRVKRLEDEGIIAGYKAILDWSKLGKQDKAIIDVALKDHSATTIDNFCSSMMSDEWVLSTRTIAGEMDVEVTLLVSGTAELDQFLRSQLYMNPLVKTVRTKIVIGENVRRMSGRVGH